MGGKLFILQAQGDPNQLVIDTLSLTDGTSTGQKTIPLTAVSGTFYSVPTLLAWKNDRLWLVLEGNVYAIDPAAGTITYKWP